MAQVFNARKSAQVIAYFVTRNDNQSLNVLKAIKLVYLSDRASVRKFGFPILDETRVSMPRGPVNSSTYSHVNGDVVDLEGSGWTEFLEDRAQHQIGAKRAFSQDELDELSEADIQCLEEVWAEFGHMNQWELVAFTHDRNNVPEWEDPNGSSVEIPLERMMTLLGIPNADEQAKIVEEHRHIDRVFGSLRE
jgi:uncharacterized phage-associated protein